MLRFLKILFRASYVLLGLLVIYSVFCTIQTIGKPHTSGIITYSPKITWGHGRFNGNTYQLGASYQVSGQKYTHKTGNRFGVFFRPQVGETTTVYYSRDNPSDAYVGSYAIIWQGVAVMSLVTLLLYAATKFIR